MVKQRANLGLSEENANTAMKKSNSMPMRTEIWTHVTDPVKLSWYLLPRMDDTK